MSLDLFNNLSNGDKKHNFVQNFIEEMSNYLKKNNSETTDKENNLRKEDCLYQVVEIGTDYAYLQNVKKEGLRLWRIVYFFQITKMLGE